MTEKEKMLAGEVYSAVDPELIEELMATREILYEFNSLRPSETQRMKEILKGLSRMVMIRFDIEHLTGKEAIELVNQHGI